jgi:hypothetical protein
LEQNTAALDIPRAAVFQNQVLVVVPVVPDVLHVIRILQHVDELLHEKIQSLQGFAALTISYAFYDFAKCTSQLIHP